HLEQIGSVSGAEVNETAQWLADLTAEHELPQKVFILHQFSLAMISDRQDIDASRPELAMVLHADGHGTREDKLSTWNTLQQGLPEGIGMAWKNFYDEDTPTFTPEETYDLEPRPWFVSYQRGGRRADEAAGARADGARRHGPLGAPAGQPRSGRAREPAPPRPRPARRPRAESARAAP